MLWFDCCMMMSVRQLVGFVSTCCVEHERPYYNYKQTTVKPQQLFFCPPQPLFHSLFSFFSFFPFLSLFLFHISFFFPFIFPQSYSLIFSIPSFYPTFHSFCVFFSLPPGKGRLQKLAPRFMNSYSFQYIYYQQIKVSALACVWRVFECV